MNDITSLISELELKLNQASVLLSNLSSELEQSFNQQTPFIFLFTVFVLACFVGYFVVWSVTPALHSPLMSVTNAISSVIIVGAVIAAGAQVFPGSWQLTPSSLLGTVGIFLAAVNIFGGFIVTRRMLAMFAGKQKKAKAKK